jgi:hypothetical protein
MKAYGLIPLLTPVKYRWTLPLRLDISDISDGYEAILGVQSRRSACMLCYHSITGVFIGRVVPPPDYRLASCSITCRATWLVV